MVSPELGIGIVELGIGIGIVSPELNWGIELELNWELGIGIIA